MLKKTGTHGSSGIKAYLESMEAASKLSRTRAQLNSGDWRSAPGAIIRNPFTETIADRSMFLRSRREKH